VRCKHTHALNICTESVRHSYLSVAQHLIKASVRHLYGAHIALREGVLTSNCQWFWARGLCVDTK